MIYKPILSDERLPILVLIVSGLLTVSDCQEDILQDIVTNVSMRASGLAGKMTDCSEYISLSNYNSTCESEVPYDKATNMSVMVHLDWNAKAALDKRCYCSSALQSLLIPTSVFTANLCDNDENSTIHCSKPCIDESQNELACDKKCGDLACFMYGKMPYILSNQMQLYLLVTGINCVTIKEHAQELCNVLFATTGPTPTATNTGKELSAGAIFFIVFVGIFLTCLCTIAAVVVRTCFLMRRKNTISQKSKSKTVNLDTGSHNRVTMILQENNMPINSQPSYMKSLIEHLIPASQIEVLEVTGQGEFGIVYRALLTLKSDEMPQVVAIKTLNGLFSKNDVNSFVEECITMSNFDNQNVLPLFGVCLDLGPAPCIIMPFMSKGNLLSYLKKERSNLTMTDISDKDTVLNVRKQLLCICLQVAKGMSYLASQHFVHRDLAARNCMIDENGIIKIADFGLTEDIYTKCYFNQFTDKNESSKNIKLPVKWMAIESLCDGIFSEKSDVWSYGVLCWEVFTLGWTPYPGLDPSGVVDLLNNGKRLNCPHNEACSQEIFVLMRSCWHESPDDRPTFEVLVSSINTLIEPLTHYISLQ